jgi:hypothetical protein
MAGHLIQNPYFIGNFKKTGIIRYMQNSFLTSLIYFIPPIILIVLLSKSLYAYCHIYRKKKNPNYPILPREAAEYLYKGEIFKILLSPIIFIKIIFERHNDKELNNAARKVRLIIFSYIGVLIIEFILLTLYLFNLPSD